MVRILTGFLTNHISHTNTKDLNFLTLIKSLNLNVIFILTIVLSLFLPLWQSNLFLSNYENTVAFGKSQAANIKPADSSISYPISISGDFHSAGNTNPKLLSPAQYQYSVSLQPANIGNGSAAKVQAVPQHYSGGSNTLEYTSRFICGTIMGEDGPLRPGRYNSDINIFNRQNFPISFFWKATLNGDTRDHNYNIQNLGPSMSMSIDCKQILTSIPEVGNVPSEKYFEGALTINVDLDPSILSAISSSKGGVAGVISGSEATSVLSVDAIYTVNALKVSNREIVLQLIEYSINNRSSNIPADMVSKVLSIAVPIKTNETIDPDRQVRTVLAREFSLTRAETASLDLTIRGLSLGVGALDDNHALSLERVNPYQPPS